MLQSYEKSSIKNEDTKKLKEIKKHEKQILSKTQEWNFTKKINAKRMKKK